MHQVCQMRGSMSKQRYLLIILIFLGCTIYAQSSWKTEFLASISDKEPIWLGRSNFYSELAIMPDLLLTLRQKLETSSTLERDFPQKTWANTAINIHYSMPFVTAKACYRNTLWGSSKPLNLFPVENPGTDYRRNAEHNSAIELSSLYHGLQTNAYAIHRHLRARPVTYVYDWETDTTTSEVHAEQGLDNIYAGSEASYQVLPDTWVGAFVNHSAANYDTGNLYRMDSAGLNAELERKLGNNTRVAGSFVWTNRFNQNLAPESRNLFQSSLRIQQSLMPGLNGFLSIQNNSCSDAEMDTLYLISNQIRAQIQYHFDFDSHKDSYLLAGAKHSQRNEASAYFAEARSLIISRVYAQAGWKWHPELYVQYNGRLSYYLYSLGELYLLYQNNELVSDPETDFHYLGFGSSIYF